MSSLASTKGSVLAVDEGCRTDIQQEELESRSLIMCNLSRRHWELNAGRALLIRFCEEVAPSILNSCQIADLPATTI